MCTENYWPDIDQLLYTNALENPIPSKSVHSTFLARIKMVQKYCEEFLQQILGWKKNVPNIRDYSLTREQRHVIIW